MRDYQVKETQCPTCATGLNGAATFDAKPRQPQLGDVTVCIYCGSILAFTAQLDLRVLLEAEVRQLDPKMQHQLQAARSAVNEVRRRMAQ